MLTMFSILGVSVRVALAELSGDSATPRSVGVTSMGKNCFFDGTVVEKVSFDVVKHGGW